MQITLEPHVAIALETAVGLTGGQEFSGFGWVRRDGDQLIVYDAVVLNVGSSGYTEIDPRLIAPLLTREDHAAMKLWVHKHPLGDGVPGPHNWSGTDNRTIREAPLGGMPELVRWSCSMVRTPLGWVGRIDNHIQGTTRHVPVAPHVPAEFFHHIETLRSEYMRRTARSWEAIGRQEICNFYENDLPKLTGGDVIYLPEGWEQLDLFGGSVTSFVQFPGECPPEWRDEEWEAAEPPVSEIDEECGWYEDDSDDRKWHDQEWSPSQRKGRRRK